VEGRQWLREVEESSELGQITDDRKKVIVFSLWIGKNILKVLATTLLDIVMHLFFVTFLTDREN
jgi:hypothetical protein